jgi:hypothetical protein
VTAPELLLAAADAMDRRVRHHDQIRGHCAWTAMSDVALQNRLHPYVLDEATKLLADAVAPPDYDHELTAVFCWFDGIARKDGRPMAFAVAALSMRAAVRQAGTAAA